MPDIPLNNPMQWTVVFRSETKVPFDPDHGILIWIKDPNAVETTYLYPTEVSKDAVGTYSVVVVASLVGDWVGYGQGRLSNGMPISTPKTVQTVTP